MGASASPRLQRPRPGRVTHGPVQTRQAFGSAGSSTSAQAVKGDQ